MPTVYTIEGPDAVGCKRVRHRKKGCTILLCPGKSKKGKRVMKFKKGTLRCPGK